MFRIGLVRRQLLSPFSWGAEAPRGLQDMRSSTPSFTLELELDLTRPGERFWEKRVHAAISVYNDCLGQCVRRLHKLRHDRTYQALLRQYAEAKKAGCPVKDISAALAARRQYFGFTEYDMHAYVCSAKHHFGTLGIDECQKLATRAFRAVEKMLYGKASRVRFVSRHEDFSIEGKSSRSALVFRKDTRTVRFGKGHEFRIRYPRSAKAKAYADEALENRVKYCRVLCRTIRGRRRWFVQAVLEGVPPARHAAGPDRPVGLDEGVSTLAVSSGPCVRLFELAPEAEPEEREIRRIRRAMDRSRRSTNPDEYAPDGTILKKKHHWAKSRRYRRLQGRLRETYRRLAALRRQSHERLANKVLSMGTDIRVEDMHIQALAKRAASSHRNRHGRLTSKRRYGGTIAVRAPAMLIGILDRKLHYIGLEAIRLDSRNLKASQYDHTAGTYAKKALSDRIVTVGGETVQRDLYSAFLLEHAAPDGRTINRKQCITDFGTFAAACQAEIEAIRQSGSRHMQWYVT